MNELGLDDHLRDQLHHLHDLAGQVSAPPSDDARQAISRRAGVLRRRRRTRQAIGGGALVVLLVAGVLALRPDDRRDPDVRSGVAEEGAEEGSLDGLVGRYLPGWDVTNVEGSSDETWDAAAEESIEPGAPQSLQVFRRPGRLDGPTIVVEHLPASDVIPEGTGEPVNIGGTTGYLTQGPASRITLAWPPVSDSHAYLRAVGLSRDQVVDFANGLQPKDDDISGVEVDPEDEFGFDATALPEGIEENRVAPVQERADFRQVDLARGSDSIQIASETTGEMVFEANVIQQLMNADSVEQVRIMDQPALLLEVANVWSLLWYDGDVGTVEIHMTVTDRATVDQVVEGLQEIPDDQWPRLVTSTD